MDDVCIVKRFVLYSASCFSDAVLIELIDICIERCEGYVGVQLY